MSLLAAVQSVLFGLGLVLSVGGLIAMFRSATYSDTRPWTGLQQRARTRKDGSTYVQTYYSKGQGVTKAEFPQGPKWVSMVGTVMFVSSLFLG